MKFLDDSLLPENQQKLAIQATPPLETEEQQVLIVSCGMAITLPAHEEASYYAGYGMGAIAAAGIAMVVGLILILCALGLEG